ncbi:hypothetical protein FRC11_005550, partial [Ceratobasidium sp. 423]
MSCRLTNVLCVLSPDDVYPVSKFLSTQPTIEELSIICQLGGLAGLRPDAFPALRDLASPSRLIPKLLKSRTPRLSRLIILGMIAEIGEFVQLSAAFRPAKPPNMTEVVMGVDITAFRMTTEMLAQGLGLLG